jgi:Ribbon-helix-helix protein, copG family
MVVWMDRDDHLARHGVTVEQAEDALLDPARATMAKNIGRILDEAAADAEASERDVDAVIPAHVNITHGGPRTKVLQVRLNDDELAALESLAAERGLPASTVVREMILNALDPAPVQTAAKRRLVGQFKQYLDTVSGPGLASPPLAALAGQTPPVTPRRRPAKASKTARRRGR